MLDRQITLDPTSTEDYKKFLQLKDLSVFKVKGNTFFTNDESYNILFGGKDKKALSVHHDKAYDYQLYFANLALKQKRYATLMQCGFGKSFIQLLYQQSISNNKGKTLFLCPLNVMQEIINDYEKFDIQCKLTNLREEKTWTDGIGLLNYESRRDIDMKGVKAVVTDEVSILKNAHGKTKKWITGLTNYVDYVLGASATPSPNYRSEYASLARYLKYVKSEKEFLAMFFRQGIKKKGEDDWMLKSHAVDAFYQYLSSFACYIHNPEKLGFEKGGYLKDEPIYNIVECEGFNEVYANQLFATKLTPQQERMIYSARGNKDTDRFQKCMELATNGEPTILWALRNEEEKSFSEELKDYGYLTINGSTPIEKRVEYINAFRSGEANGIISKLQVLGWGVNLQRASQQILSGYDSSFEKIYQGIRRSHRNGREGRLTVHIPMTEPERIIWARNERKLKTYNTDVAKLQDRFCQRLDLSR